MPSQEFIVGGVNPSVSYVVDTPHRAKPSLRHNKNQSPLLNALRFVSRPENKINPNEEGLICSDDRWWNTEGRIARFGGSAGYVLGLLAINKYVGLGLSPEQIVDRTVHAKKGKFNFHTDEAALTTDYGIGCAHLAKAMFPGYSEKYGVDFEDVVRAVSYMKHLAKEKPEKVTMDIASGSHGAEAVFVNMGNKKLSHCDEHSKYYIIDKKREDEYLEGFYPRLVSQLPRLKEKGIDLGLFKKILELQTAATAHILAEGYPVFEINADNPRLPMIQKAGFIG